MEGQPACRAGSSDPQWSVIVIARDEEAVIGASLQSVVTAFQGKSYELIVVDSASQDRTAAIAAEFTPHVIQLPASAPLRPAVGRHVGLQAARGQWLLFLDGDSLLEPGWLEQAAAALVAEPRLAGVAGDMTHILRDDQGVVITRYRHQYSALDYRAAEQLYGSAVYKRSALEQAGGFNPFLYSCEEAELGGRLRKHGFQLRRLAVPMTRHSLKHQGSSLTEVWRRMRRRYFVGDGQFLRHSLKYGLRYQEPQSRPIYYMIRPLQTLVLLVLGGAAAITSWLSGQSLFFFAWLGLLLLVYIAYVIHSRSFRRPATQLLQWAMTAPMMVWGFCQQPRPIDEFPNIVPTTRRGAERNRA